MKRPRVRLIYPDGAVEHYDDCVISDSLIPDLSFVGTNIITEEREKVVTNLTYKIVSEPPTAEESIAAMNRLLNAMQTPGKAA